MSRLLTYTRLSFKRAFRLLPVILVFTLALLIALGVLLGIFVRNNDNSEANIKLAVGIVGETEGSYLGFGFVTVMELDSSRFAVDFLPMTLDEAESALKNGILDSYVIIPDNFMDEATKGNIMSLEYVTDPNGSSIAAVFRTEVLSGIVKMLESSERAVYGLQDALHGVGMKKGVGKRMDGLYNRFVSLVLSRSNAVKTQESGFAEGLSVAGYFLCGFFVMFVMLWAVTCSAYFSRRSRALSRLLCSKGCGAVRQVTGEYAAYLGIMLITFAVMIFGAFVIFGGSMSAVKELKDVGAVGVLRLYFGMMPVFFALSAMQFMLYELTDGVISAVLVQFTLGLALSYISGLMYPAGFFPQTVQSIARVLPAGLARGYADALILGDVNVNCALGLAGWFVLFVGIAATVRGARIRSRRAAC